MDRMDQCSEATPKSQKNGGSFHRFLLTFTRGYDEYIHPFSLHSNPPSSVGDRLLSQDLLLISPRIVGKNKAIYIL